MATNPPYVLDANVFIEAQRRYYGFDLCPGFWQCLKYHNEGSVLVSIDRVKKELAGEDDLQEWIKNTAAEVFVSSDASEVVRCYQQIVNWIYDQDQFHAAAVEEFAGIADGWLVAYAMNRDCTVVTHEVYAAGAKKKIPIPNICKAFSVDYVNTFDMLKALETQFHWTTP